MIYANAQSLFANFDMFEELCKKKKPKILMLSETHVTDDFKDAEINIEGYKIERCDSNSRHTGGVIMYINDEINYKVIYRQQKSRTWILTIKTSNSLMNGTFSVVYKSPKEKINDFLSIIDEFCEEIIDDDDKNVIVGDFNIDVSKNHKNCKRYLECIAPHNLKQIVDEPTRINETRRTQTIIDHILTNSNDIRFSINKEETVTDHFMLEIKCNIIVKKEKQKEKKWKNCWKLYSKEKLNEELKKIKYKRDINVNEASKNLMENLENVMLRLVKKKEVKKKTNKWFSTKLSLMKKLKEKAREKVSYTNSEDDKKDLIVKSTLYKEEIKREKCNEIQRKIKENKNDPKKLWKVLKSLYKEEKNEIRSVHVNNVELNDSSEIAIALNEFFVNSVENIVKEIPDSKMVDYIEKIVKRKSVFKLREINMNEMKQTIEGLKNKSFIDNINGKVLVDAISNESFCEEILKIINVSITSSTMQ